MVEMLAAHLDVERFGVKALYLFGSTKHGTAVPASDIDILVHVGGTAEQLAALLQWLEGWSRRLSEMNYLRTGCVTDGLLDVHVITDENIVRRTWAAVKIGAVDDAALPIPLGQTPGVSDADV